MLKQKLQHKLLQKLSPQQIQLIKLLEVPTVLLEQRIKSEIEENPVLEEGAPEPTEEISPEEKASEDSEKEDFTLDEFLNREDTPSYKLNANNHSKDDKQVEMPYSEGSTFHETLMNQLGLQLLSDFDRKIAEYIIGNIDDDGYLRRETDAIVDDLAFLQNISVEERVILQNLKVIQNFDPPGVGARTLQECLEIQLKRKLKNDPERDSLQTARRIIHDHFESFTKKHYEKIEARLGISEEDLKDAIDEILHLNPKPGGSFSEGQSATFEHIIPDFILEITNGRINVSLNSRNAPELRVNKTYMNMIEAYANKKGKASRKDKEALTFVKQKLDSAKWFIDAIKQRQNTLMHTMNAIIEYQKEYFMEGDEKKMRPMILKDIAEKTHLDISTISRVANSKYIQTHFGIYPLKYFFSEGMQTESGEEVSTREIKKILQDCIGNESKRRPLTDEKLADILKEKGYKIARRTVAKYREQLNIPVARLRKEL